MRIHTLQLIDFKRFSNLTLNLRDRPSKIVALVGPNGSGKSSVFDAFDDFGSQFKGRPGRSASYYKKSTFTEENPDGNYDLNFHVHIASSDEAYDRKSFYIRSAFRFTSRLNVTQIRKLDDVEQDQARPQSLIDPDSRLQDNYERLIGRFFGDMYGKEITGKAWAQQNVDGLNAILRAVLDISVSDIGNPVDGEGRLYFDKGDSKRFPYDNLSAGEKEVVDLVLDLYVKRSIYTNSVICIDEPELHLNTAVQRRLLVELEKLVPDESQLWIATHSIGFLRALQEDLWEKTAVIDFTGVNFDQPATLTPIAGTRSDWMRIFETALEDLTGLLAPKRIVYCEGRPDADPAGAEMGLDADVYNRVFAEAHPDTLFVSSGGGGEARKNALLALNVLKKALTDVEFLVLRDRDTKTDAERTAYLAAGTAHRMCDRREIENYLFDPEVLEVFCGARGRAFDRARYDAHVTDIPLQDLKPTQDHIKAACGERGDMDAFKRELGNFIMPGAATYNALHAAIFD